ncbi:hypothetical protein JW752_00505 [Candidatus Peregrinibacteria bacterium]|nr:hypothetical protein [Candidatus Peregrinibacteria bacterium]
MKRFIVLIIVLLFLSACGAEPISMENGRQKKPRIPSGKSLQANVLSTTHYTEKDTLDMDRLVDTINQNIKKPVITGEEIERGWYYGKKEEKKIGTPSSWIWTDEGFKSRWISPNVAEDEDYLLLDDLCQSTGGVYAVSCVEHETPDCEFIPQSYCRCPGSSKWADDQGCIRTDEAGEWVLVTSDELKRGWYEGLSNEKKLNTPLSWIWAAVEGGGRWQNQRPME